MKMIGMFSVLAFVPISCLAQADAFAFGYTREQAASELAARGVDAARIELLARHKVHAGNRPVSIVAF